MKKYNQRYKWTEKGFLSICNRLKIKVFFTICIKHSFIKKHHCLLKMCFTKLRQCVSPAALWKMFLPLVIIVCIIISVLFCVRLQFVLDSVLSKSLYVCVDSKILACFWHVLKISVLKTLQRNSTRCFNLTLNYQVASKYPSVNILTRLLIDWLID